MNTVSFYTVPLYQNGQLTPPQIRSVGYGWGILVLAGGGSYYFAKRSINADRAQRAEAEEQRRQQRERLRMQALMHDAETGTGSGTTTGLSNAKRKEKLPRHGDDNPDPSLQGSGDPAPVTHAQEQAAVRGKYEAAEPFRSRKGDRFS